MDKLSLEEICLRHGAIMSLDRQRRLATYEALLSGRRAAPVHVLELICSGGATIAPWVSYFNNASSVQSHEWEPGELPLSGDTTVDLREHFDVIITDASDGTNYNASDFASCIGMLAEGGLLIVERVRHTGCGPLSGDEENAANDLSLFLEGLADLVRQRLWQNGASRVEMLRALSTMHATIDVDALVEVQSVEFISELCVLRKSAAGTERLRRTLQATEARVIAQQARVATLEGELAHQSRALEQRDLLITALRTSSSWRITSPLRFVFTQLYRARRAGRIIGSALQLGGGSINTTKRALSLYRKEGWAGIRRGVRIADANGNPLTANGPGLLSPTDYAEWVRRYDSLDEGGRKRIQERIDALPRLPLISVLMPVYNAPLVYLEQAIDSVRAQLYTNWELCIADDASTLPGVRRMLEQQSQRDHRIKVVYREENGHISASSNSALTLVSGEFVALLDHDDMLAETALYRIVTAIIAHPEALLIYSDEDKIDAENTRHDPYFKSDFNYELLLAQNMISHLGAYRTATLRDMGGFRPGLEGAQDYDLALRVAERAKAGQIVHLPYVLYHWRAIAGSTALAAGEKNYAALAGRQAVVDHLARCGISAAVLPAPVTPDVNRVRFACPVPQPLVSILIPTRDRADLLGMCLDLLITRSTYVNYEVIIIDNGSVEDATQRLFARLPQPRFKVIRDESPFNFSALNNNAARVASGQYLCLMNNDIEILTPDWLEEMVSFATRPEVGCVGARLWYPDGRLQHGGVVLGIGGVAGHAHKYLPRGQNGYFGRAILHQSYSAVTAACLLLRREVFEQVGGLDEQLAIAFNDVDFCLRVREAGYRNVWTPYAEMIHHESASRGEEDNPEKIARFGQEIAFIEARWGSQLRTDPAYNPNLTLVHEDYSLAWPPHVTPL